MVNKREVSGKAGGRLSTEREGGGPRANEATYPAGMGFRRGETREVKGRPGCSGRGERGRHEAVSPSQSSTGVGGGVVGRNPDTTGRRTHRPRIELPVRPRIRGPQKRRGQRRRDTHPLPSAGENPGASGRGGGSGLPQPLTEPQR